MVQPYSREFFAPRPARFTLFFRTFFLWQLVRFVWINVKMIRMIEKAHGHHVDPAPPTINAGGAEAPKGSAGAAAPAPLPH